MRILTGIQPSGIPHLGNYFGAMRQVCELQDRGESFLFIADYHSLTTNPKAQDLRDRVWDGLNQTHRQIIMDLPNFDAEIFRKCTGIKV